MTKLLPILAIGLFLTAPFRAAANDHPGMTVREANAKPRLSAKAPLVGYVLLRFACPPCPRGAVCEACIGEHILVGDHVTVTTAKSLAASGKIEADQLLLFGETAALLLGRRYRFELIPNEARWSPTDQLKHHLERKLRFSSANPYDP